MAEHERPETVARVLDCSLARVSNWAAAWQFSGLAGLREQPRLGKPHRLDATAEHLLTRLLETDPQHRDYHTTGWTVPLLQTELA